MSDLDLDAIEAQLPHDARMEAYYYHFKRTGVGLVDAILCAVAVAGKGAHHTESWSYGGNFDYYHGWPGLPESADSAVDLIQSTANRSAEQVTTLIAEIRRLRADLDAVRALAGPDNESGFISTDALLHTIGTGESMLTEFHPEIAQVLGVES